MTNGAAPRIEVVFSSEYISQSVVVDDKGFYQIDLPLGTYTMTAAFPGFGPKHISPLTKYIRFFQVVSPTKIKLNGVLFGDYSCDGVWMAENEEEQKELFKDTCGGEDSFLAPSSDGTPFQLDIRYVRRQRTGRSFAYGNNAAVRRPVLVTYNLFSLQADSVVYDTTNRVVRASGNVLIEDQLGRTNAESVAFKIEGGKLTRAK